MIHRGTIWDVLVCVFEEQEQDEEVRSTVFWNLVRDELQPYTSNMAFLYSFHHSYGRYGSWSGIKLHRGRRSGCSPEPEETAQLSVNTLIVLAPHDMELRYQYPSVCIAGKNDVPHADRPHRCTSCSRISFQRYPRHPESFFMTHHRRIRTCGVLYSLPLLQSPRSNDNPS